MAQDKANIIAYLNANIVTNGTQAITGAIMNTALNAMMDMDIRTDGYLILCSARGCTRPR